jgi:hypothetical protein
MEDARVEAKLRSVIRPLVTEAVTSIDVQRAGLTESVVTGGSPSRLSLAAAVIVVAVVVVVLRSTDGVVGPSAGAAGVNLGEGSLTVSYLGGAVLVTYAPTSGQNKNATVVLTLPVGDGEFAVRQVVCAVDSPMSRHVILFGRVPAASPPIVTVTGLGAVVSGSGDDGSFVVASEGAPLVGAPWTLSAAGYPAITGHVAVMATRLAEPASSQQGCRAYDPAQESRKP